MVIKEKRVKRRGDLVSGFRVNTFLRALICFVSGCIGRIGEKFNVERCLGLHVFSTDSICIFVRPHALVAAI